MKIKLRFAQALLWLILSPAIIGCTDLDDVNDRIDAIEVEIDGLKTSIKALQDAYASGKLISSVDALTTSGAGGWKITFSDGTSIDLENGSDGANGTDGKDGIDGKNGSDGKDGQTPFLKVDHDGNWIVSFDGGKTFSPILDADGNPMRAIGTDGKDGADGKDGIDGKDGVSVRIIVNENGYYVIQTYLETAPDEILSETVTSYSSNPTNIISNITQDNINDIITITMADGSEFKFPLAGSSATGIVLLSSTDIKLTAGGEATLIFRINPSDADIDFNVDNSDCQIALDLIGNASRSLVVTAPENFKLIEVSRSISDNGNYIPGQYTAKIKDTRNAIGYCQTAVLVVTGTGISQISSQPITFTSVEYPELVATGLPIVMLDTPDGENIVSKDDWMTDATLTIYDSNGELDYSGPLSVKGRGNSTWGYPKKPYALKLDKKSKILGMNKHKRWCLLANWMDRTHIRNAVSFEISRKTGLDYTPAGKFVELVLNGKHCGNYYLTEQIKVDENRVNVAELDPDATEGDAITGGYLFELDIYFDEVYKFRSSVLNIPWMFKDPDEVNAAQFDYVQNFVNEMENSLCDPVKFQNREFSDYMDLESFVDWWFVYELAMNGEPGWPKSSYMHKDINGKMKAGPVWDFDYGTYMLGNTNSFTIKNTIYYNQLFNNPEFVHLVKTRWAQFKPGFDKIPAFIDSLKAQLSESDKLDSPMWPFNGFVVNQDESLDYNSAVERLKSAYTAKLEWMDSAIQAL